MNERDFFYRLGKVIYQIDNTYEKYGAKETINAPNLLWILYALNDGNEHSQRQICDDWAIPRSTANTIIKDLEKRGYIVLNAIQGKRRELSISLTGTGQEYANKLLERLYEKEKEIYKTLKDADAFINELESFAIKLEMINDEN